MRMGLGRGRCPEEGVGRKVAQSCAVMGPWWGRLFSRSSCALGVPTAVGTTLRLCSTQATRGRSPGASREGPGHGQ